MVDAEVAVVTNISYDHTDVLGPTLEGIARDKAGIIKPGATVVIGETDPALVALLAEAAAGGSGRARSGCAGREFDCTANRLAVGGRLVDLRTPGAAYDELLVPLHGPHQGANAACALAAAEAFFGAPARRGGGGGGLRRRAGARPSGGGGPPAALLVDGAHNVAGMEALARALAEELRGRRASRWPWSACSAAATPWPCSRPWPRPA